jgi:pyrroloquinoline quinone biosynthesis protein E
VALSGGEPLLYPNLTEITSFLSERNQKTILTTNGRIFTEERAVRLKTAGLSGVQVPLLSADPQLHDEIAGRASWDGAIRALAISLELGLATSATFVATRRNIDQLGDVVKLAEAIGVRRLLVNDLHPAGAALENLDQIGVESRQVLEAYEDAVRAANEVQLLLVPDMEAIDQALQNGRRWLRWSLSPDGDIKLCNQSTKVIGRLENLTNRQLDALVQDFSGGQIAKYRGRVNNCRCFDRYMVAVQAT